MRRRSLIRMPPGDQPRARIRNLFNRCRPFTVSLMVTKKLLLVEDEFLIRQTLAEALVEQGFDVIEAGRADDALRVLQAEPEIALLLTDVQLPGDMDGVQLASALRQFVPELPVVFMSGRPDRLESVVDSPRDAVIIKPYLPSEGCRAARRVTGG